MSEHRVYTVVEEQVVIKERTKLASQPCLFCGKEPDERCDDEDAGAIWRKDPLNSYYHTCVAVAIQNHSTFPEHTTCELEQWDICPDCFNEKLRPILGNPHKRRLY